MFNHAEKPPPQVEPEPKVQTTEPQKELTASYLVSGDVFWGRGIDYFASRSPLKEAWPFSRLNEFHPENYDGWIADMECPVNKTVIPYQTQVDKLLFSCQEKYLPEASKYFTAMTLANNHTDNTGRDGFLATRDNLNKAGIQAFGDPDINQQDNLCEVVSMPVKVDNNKANLPIAMCAYHWLTGAPTQAQIDEITRYSHYFPVWVFPHGGTEYETGFTSEQQALYRKFIDAGASVVIGDHPHVVEPTESYKGKLIVYSTGNLILDQWFDKEVTKSLILNINLSALVDNTLEKYLKLADSCKVFADDCLALAEEQNLAGYKMKYKFKVIAGERSNVSMEDRVTHPASEAIHQWLLKRLDWQNTLDGLLPDAY